MKPPFWIKRFFVVLLGAFSLLLVVNVIKQRPLESAAAESAVWASITAIVFVTARFYQSRRGQHCALCRDTPEMAQRGQCEVASAARLEKRMPYRSSSTR